MTGPGLSRIRPCVRGRISFGAMDGHKDPDSEWISWPFAAEMIQHGHIEVVRRLAEAGDGFCAVVLAYEYAAAGDPEAASAMLEPFVVDGWWGAIQTAACVLSDAGRGDEAVALCLPSVENGGYRTITFVAELLLRHGRGDEAFALMQARIADEFYLNKLVEVSAGLGRDEEVLAMLDEWAGRGCRTGRPVALMATVLERQGRVDEAVDLLQDANIVRQLAGVLARQGRHDEVHALIEGYGKEYAAKELALHLESVGDVEGAIAVLEPGAADGHRNYSVYLAELLIRIGRVDGAIAVVRRALPLDPECLLDWWRRLMVEHSRVAEALAIVDELAQGPHGMTERLYGEWLCLLVHAGRKDQALRKVVARPEGEWDGAEVVAETLAELGRIDEALDVYERYCDPQYNKYQIASLLVLQGRVEEALAVVPRDKDRELRRPYTLN